nr:MAG TPA: hypothetical protein [Bacteriophage sp.]
MVVFIFLNLHSFSNFILKIRQAFACYCLNNDVRR